MLRESLLWLSMHQARIEDLRPHR